jgi:hypothetical protein
MARALAVGMLAACASEPVVTPPRTAQGVGRRALVGGAVVVDKDDRWRGAAPGAALGAIVDGNLTEMASRAAREAIASNRPMAYQSTDGWQRIEAMPRGASQIAGCRQVRERVYQDHQLVREQIREVC